MKTPKQAVAGDLLRVVDRMPQGVWGWPFDRNPDTWLIPAAIDREAIQAIVTNAVRLGNDSAAHNSGMDKDQIEATGEYFADEIMEALEIK